MEPHRFGTVARAWPILRALAPVSGDDPMTAPTPHNEEERLQSLRALEILDTAPEERFDRITRLAAQIVGTPIVLISLVDEARQWFKSSVGVDVSQTPRDIAFCAHAILDSEVFVVPDAQEDPRFATDLLVT